MQFLSSVHVLLFLFLPREHVIPSNYTRSNSNNQFLEFLETYKKVLNDVVMVLFTTMHLYCALSKNFLTISTNHLSSGFSPNDAHWHSHLSPGHCYRKPRPTGKCKNAIVTQGGTNVTKTIPSPSGLLDFVVLFVTSQFTLCLHQIDRDNARLLQKAICDLGVQQIAKKSVVFKILYGLVQSLHSTQGCGERGQKGHWTSTGHTDHQ